MASDWTETQESDPGVLKGVLKGFRKPRVRGQAGRCSLPKPSSPPAALGPGPWLPGAATFPARPVAAGVPACGVHSLSGIRSFYPGPKDHFG